MAKPKVAPGIPKRKISPLPTVERPIVWPVSAHLHDAKRAGKHIDLRLGDLATGVAHSFVLPRKDKLPGPGEASRVIPTFDHTISYMDFVGDLPPGYGHGKVVKGRRTGAEVYHSDPSPGPGTKMRFNLYEGDQPEEFSIRKDKEGRWYLHNKTQTREKRPDIPDSKSKYKEIDPSEVRVTDDDQVLMPKLDGAHGIVELKAGRSPRVFSYRVAKKAKTGLIEHTHKIPELLKKKVPKELDGTILRGEILGLSEDDRAIPAEQIGGLLNSKVWESRRKQEETGTRLKIFPFTVVKHKGKLLEGAPFDEQLKILDEVQSKLEQLSHPELATSSADKDRLLAQIRNKEHPLTDEGVVAADRYRPGRYTKAKYAPDFDIYVRKVHAAVSGETGEEHDRAGAVSYSWTPDGPIVGQLGGFKHDEARDMLKDPSKYVGRVAKVKAMKRFETKSGEPAALFQPRFKEWHLDKGEIEKIASVPSSDTMKKLSARAGLKIIRRLAEKGDPKSLARAEELASRMGVLKETALGHQVKRLGRGSEGIADLVAGGKGAPGTPGISVRKLYDPHSRVASPELIKRKVELGKVIDDPALAKTYGQVKTPRGGDATFHEYVPSKPYDLAETGRGVDRVQSAARKAGYQVADVNPVVEGGYRNVEGGKIIDPLYFTPSEYMGMVGNVMVMTSKGLRALGQGGKVPTKEKDVLRLMRPAPQGGKEKLKDLLDRARIRGRAELISKGPLIASGSIAAPVGAAGLMLQGKNEEQEPASKPRFKQAPMQKAAEVTSAASGLKKGVVLFPHQEAATDKVLKQGGDLLLSHGTGSGKTLTAIAAFEKMRDTGDADKALVVTPAALRANYLDNGVRKFTTGRGAILGNTQEVAKGVARAPDDPDPGARYHIISYEMFRKDPKKVLEATGADTVIYDELHKIKNEQGATSKTIKDARQHHKNFIGLTGSIMSNTPADLVPLVDAMTNGNHKLGTKANFERRFVSDGKNGKDISRPFMVRTLLSPYVDHFETKDMGDERMPNKVVQEVKVMMNPEQEELYRYVIKKMDPVTAVKFRLGATKLKKNDIQNIFNQITQARQAANSIHTINLDVTPEQAAERTPKVKKLLDDVGDHLQETPDGQVVVHSNLIRGGVDVLSAGLKKKGISYSTFIGKGQPGVTEESRQKAVKDFNKGKSKVIVISSAGGEGLDLKNSTMFASLDGHFNPEKIQQAEARAVRAGGLAHRPVDKRNVIVRRYVSVVPRSKTQVALDTMNLVDPMGMLNRALSPDQPLFYNPFKRERSPDEWMYEVANDKDKLNEAFRHQLKTASAQPEVQFDNAEDLLGYAEDTLFKIAQLQSFGEELIKEASRRKVQEIPFQPFKFIKSDSHIMNNYWSIHGKAIENMDNPYSGGLPTAEMKVDEQRHVDALRTYYREAAKGKGAPPKNTHTDKDVVKNLAKAIAATSSLAFVPTTAYAVADGIGAAVSAPKGKRLKAAGEAAKLVMGAGSVMGGLLAATAASFGVAGLYDPYFTTPKTQARKAAKFSDEQLRTMLRGLSVTQEQVKVTEHFIK